MVSCCSYCNEVVSASCFQLAYVLRLFSLPYACKDTSTRTQTAKTRILVSL